MKTIVLEHPRIASEKRFNDIANTPLWSCLMGGYAVSALESQGIDTVLLDHAVPGAGFDRTMDAVLALGPDLLCVNTVYFWEHTRVLFDFFDGLRARGWDGHLNLFGFLPSLIYRNILDACAAVDSIAVGEFEHTLPETAMALTSGRTLEQIPGLALRSCLLDQKSRMRPPEKDPDVFAFPKRLSLEGTVSVLASRGCYNHCSFCPVPPFYNQGRLWRGRSPENIAREIRMLTEQGATRFYFCDPNFIGPGRKGRERTMALMDLIRPLDIRFGMETRPQDLDDAVLEKLTGAGFESLLMGIESGSANVLKRIDKQTDATLASDAIALCRRHGIEPEVGFLMFVPDSGLADLAQNMAFLSQNNLLDRLDRTANLLSHTQIVLAGTSGYQRFDAENRLKKSGMFGFEADVIFSDPAVEWVAILLTNACHMVLRCMSDSSSPIYWEKDAPGISKAVNDHLVALARDLIHRAETEANPGDTEQLLQEKTAIRDGLAQLLPELSAG